MSLSLPYPIALNRAYRNFRGQMVLSPEAKAWKRQAAWLAKSDGVRPIQAGAVWVNIVLHPKMTKSGEASKTRVDLDSIFKLLLDALNGVAWTDDKQIERLIAEVGHPVDGGGLSVMVGKL